MEEMTVSARTRKSDMHEVFWLCIQLTVFHHLQAALGLIEVMLDPHSI